MTPGSLRRPSFVSLRSLGSDEGWRITLSIWSRKSTTGERSSPAFAIWWKESPVPETAHQAFSARRLLGTPILLAIASALEGQVVDANWSQAFQLSTPEWTADR